MRKTTIILTLFFSFSLCHAQLEWQALNSVPSEDYFTLHQILSGSALYVAGANGIHYRTTDFFDNATTVNNSTTETIRDFHIPSSGNYWFCGTDGMVKVSIDAGVTWLVRAPVSNANFNSLGSRSSGIAMVVGDGGAAFKGTTSGTNWSNASTAAVSTDNLNYVMAPVIGGNTFITAGNNGTLLKTVDSGVTWTQQVNNVSEDLHTGVQAAANRVIIGGENGIILYSDDLGDNWTETNVGSNEALYGMTSSTGNGSQIIACGSNGSLFRSNDAGETWFELCSPTNEELRDVLFFGGAIDILIIAGMNGIMYRADDASGNCDPTGIENHLNPIIKGLTVYNNPNSQLVQVSYDMIISDELKISVYDLTGKRVFVQNEGIRTIGNHTLQIDASKWSTGLYSLILSASDYFVYEKIVVQQ